MSEQSFAPDSEREESAPRIETCGDLAEFSGAVHEEFAKGASRPAAHTLDLSRATVRRMASLVNPASLGGRD